MKAQEKTIDGTLNPARPVEKLLHDKHEAAAMLGCSWRHVQNLTTKRLLASVRLGRLVRYRRADIEKALDRLTVKAR